MRRILCLCTIGMICLATLSACGKADGVSVMESDTAKNNTVQASSEETSESKEVYDDVRIENLNMEKGTVYTAYIFIDSYDLASRTITLDAVEWIDNEARATEVGLNYETDMPEGYFIYNAVAILETLPVSQDLIYYMLNETTPMKVSEDVLWKFIDYMKEAHFNYPFKIRILNGEITQIDEVYMP